MRLSLGLLGKKISQFEIMRMLRKSLAHGNMHLGRMVTDTSICTSCRCRGGGLKGLTVCTVGSEPWRGSLSGRIPSSTHAFVFWSFGEKVFARKLKPVSPCHA
jgi:hypothetical protein